MRAAARRPSSCPGRLPRAVPALTLLLTPVLQASDVRRADAEAVWEFDVNSSAPATASDFEEWNARGLADPCMEHYLKCALWPVEGGCPPACKHDWQDCEPFTNECPEVCRADWDEEREGDRDGACLEKAESVNSWNPLSISFWTRRRRGKEVKTQPDNSSSGRQVSAAAAAVIDRRDRCAAVCAWFRCAGHTGPAYAVCAAVRQRRQDWLNTIEDGRPDATCVPPECVPGRSIWADPHGEDVRVVLVYGVPMLVARLPEKFRGERGERWKAWLRDSAPTWREMNGGILQVSYRGAKNAYNVFDEARRAGGFFEAFGNELLAWMIKQVESFMKQVRKIVDSMAPLARRKLKDTVVEEAAPLIAVYCWANVFHSTGPHAKEVFVGQLHDHAWPFHGFFVWNGSQTNTTYIGPSGRMFNIVNEDYTMSMLVGGVKHAALHPGARADPRITQAFDIDFKVGMPHGITGKHLSKDERVTFVNTEGRSEMSKMIAHQFSKEGIWGGAMDFGRFFGKGKLKPTSKRLEL